MLDILDKIEIPGLDNEFMYKRNQLKSANIMRRPT